VIVGAALCPHPPLLLRELTGGHDVGAGLRAACLDALRTVLELHPAEVVVVGGADAGGEPPAGAVLDVHAFGGPSPAPVADGSGAPPGLPLSLGIGARLLDLAGWTGARRLHAVPWDAEPSHCLALGRALAVGPTPTALLVLGDASARRAVRAPGHLDPRAESFDAAVTRAVADGDARALAATDPATAADLLAAGRAAWQVLAGAMPSADARLLKADDPFGVLYLVATWLPVPPM
jgi:hypothetical protein